MDQQDAMERLQQLYLEKNEHMEKFLESVTPFEFYREIFPEGSLERRGHYEDAKGNGIAITVPKRAGTNGIALEIEGDGKARRHTITDELDTLQELQDTDFTIMSPISYFGRQRSSKNARYLYALVFDLDGVGMPQLGDTEIFAYPADLEQVYFNDQGAADAKRFTGVSCDRLQLQVGARISCGGISVWGGGRAGEAVGLYPGQ